MLRNTVRTMRNTVRTMRKESLERSLQTSQLTMHACDPVLAIVIVDQPLSLHRDTLVNVNKPWHEHKGCKSVAR